MCRRPGWQRRRTGKGSGLFRQNQGRLREEGARGEDWAHPERDVTWTGTDVQSSGTGLSADGPPAPSAKTRGSESYTWPARVCCEACTVFFNLDLFPACLESRFPASVEKRDDLASLDPRSCVEPSGVRPHRAQHQIAAPGWPTSRLAGPRGRLSLRAWHQALTAVAQRWRNRNFCLFSLSNQKARYEALPDRRASTNPASSGLGVVKLARRPRGAETQRRPATRQRHRPPWCALASAFELESPGKAQGAGRQRVRGPPARAQPGDFRYLAPVSRRNINV